MGCAPHHFSLCGIPHTDSYGTNNAISLGISGNHETISCRQWESVLFSATTNEQHKEKQHSHLLFPRLQLLQPTEAD